MRILIIEDNIRLAENIKTYLEMEKCKVETTRDGKRGLYLALINMYDAIILDINLPEMDGFTVCQQLRKKNNNTPILMLTSRHILKDKIQGLNIGADDYVTKPFEYEEILARLNAMIRRECGTKAATMEINDIVVNFQNKEIRKNNQIIELSPLESELILFLAKNKGKVICRRELLEKVWGDFEEHALSRTVDIYIGYLRKKLGQDTIRTKKGFGYFIP